MFEHWLGLKPWDLERMSRSDVAWRLEWIKKRVESERESDG